MDTPNLYYYYKRGVEPFRTVMDLTAEELIAFMQTHLPEEDIFHKDPLRYIAKRRETESWLHASFCQIGGRPACSKPIYMTLGRSRYIERLGIYTECLEVPLSLFAPDSLSFTYTDSYVSRWLAEVAHECFNPQLHGRVFTLTEMLALLSGMTHADGRNSDHRRYDFFVEAQVWNGEPLQRFGRKRDRVGTDISFRKTMNRFIPALLFPIVAMGISGCALSNHKANTGAAEKPMASGSVEPTPSPASKTPGRENIASGSATLGAKNAVVQVGDVLAVSVAEDHSFDGYYEVRLGGYFIIPSIGRIDAVGLPLKEVEVNVTKALEDTQLAHATVKVGMLSEAGSGGQR